MIKLFDLNYIDIKNILILISINNIVINKNLYDHLESFLS